MEPRSATPAPASVRRLAAALLLGMALAVAPAARSAADLAPGLPYPSLEAVWLPPAPTPRPDAAGTLAMVNIPPGWSAGDAAVVALWGGGGGDPSGNRPRLLRALLGAGAAVLELRDAPPGPPGAPDPSLLPRALHALRHELGAGLLVAVGTGEAGPAARLAARGPALAAAIAIAGGGIDVAPGEEVPGAAEAWPVRGRHLCELLAAAVVAQAEEERADPAGWQARRDGCLAGLGLR